MIILFGVEIVLNFIYGMLTKLAPVFFWYYPVSFECSFLFHKKGITGIPYTFPAPNMESAITPGGEWHLETKIWVLSVVTAIR